MVTNRFCESSLIPWWVAIVAQREDVMHAKFRHELCSLLMHIPIYLDVMSCYNDVLHWFMRIFDWSPYFAYNFVEQETPVLCILMFEGPFGTQIDRGFSSVNLFTSEATWDEEGRAGGTRAQMSTGGMGPSQATPTDPVWPSDIRCRPSSLQIAHLDLKSPI
jgi:hypothetical protein